MTTSQWRGVWFAVLLLALSAAVWIGPLGAQEEEADAGEVAAEENVSADNSLSFPVDI